MVTTPIVCNVVVAFVPDAAKAFVSCQAYSLAYLSLHTTQPHTRISFGNVLLLPLLPRMASFV